MIDINTLVELEDFKNNNEAILIYFSTPQCSVCKVLKPKLINFVNAEFPKMKMAYINSESLSDVAAQNSIFSVPTILVFLDGREFLRKSRNINLVEFHAELERPYSMFFGS